MKVFVVITNRQVDCLLNGQPWEQSRYGNKCNKFLLEWQQVTDDLIAELISIVLSRIDLTLQLKCQKIR